MLQPDLLLPETPRPLKRVEYDRLVALGVFADSRTSPSFRSVATGPLTPSARTW